MLNYNDKLLTLKAKGGIMFFTIVRPTRVYRGLVIVSAERDNRCNRDVFVKEYKYTQIP
jgi:hypothetical protein